MRQRIARSVKRRFGVGYLKIDHKMFVSLTCSRHLPPKLPVVRITSTVEFRSQPLQVQWRRGMDTFNLDARQLARIEAVHRGFLYQHLYAAACSFCAARSGITHIFVENDDDVEVVLPDGRISSRPRLLLIDP